MDASNKELLFDIPATLEKPRRSFTLVKGEIAPPIDDPDAINASEIIGHPHSPQSFQELDSLVAVKAALWRHHKKVAEARLADAKGYEQQLNGLLRKYEYLVPAPLQGKAWKASVGVYSGGKYRYQPERAAVFTFEDKDQAMEAGLTATYEVVKIDLDAVRTYVGKHGVKDIPGIKRTEPSVVSFKPIGNGTSSK